MARAKAKGGKDAAAQDTGMSVSAHPRARTAVRATRAWGGLLGFAVVAVLSWRAGVAPFEVGVRALVAGLVVFLFAWAASVSLWRRIVVHEAQTEARRLIEERDERLAALQAAQDEAA